MKVAKARTRTSRLGNSEGYALIDAIVAMLVVSIVAGAVLAGIGSAARFSAIRFEKTVVHVEKRNEEAKKNIEGTLAEDE